jgi:hypothetical protein
MSAAMKHEGFTPGPVCAWCHTTPHTPTCNRPTHLERIADAPALYAENERLRAALREIEEAEAFDTETFVCDFDTLQSIARAALVAPKG